MARESFKSLGLNGYLADRIQNVDHIFEIITSQDIEDAWQSAPEDLAQKLRASARSGSVSIRGYLWELYVWSKLSIPGNRVTYEEVIPGRKTKFDFKVTNLAGYTYYVEAKSMGPNEDELATGQTEFQGDLALKFREQIRSFLRQTEEFKNGPVLLALGNGYQRYFQSTFETIKCLYGQPAITINKETNESWSSWSDQGFWHPQSNAERSFDGIIFLDGLVPGFSTFNEPELWLNPIAPYAFDIHELSWPMNIYKSDAKLYKTSKKDNFIWAPVSFYS